MATEAEMFEQGGQMVRDVGAKALQQSGGLLGGMWDMVKSAVSAPFSVVGGMAKKAVGGIFSYGPWIAGGTALMSLFAPDLIRGAGELTGRTDISDKIGADVDKGGVPALAMKALAAGAIGGGGIGALTGAWQGITGGVAEGEPAPSTGARIGSAFGTVATVGLLAVVGANLFKDGGVAHDAKKDGDEVKIPPMPKAAGQSQALDA